MANETSSTHRTVVVTGVHRFKVVGHSLTKGMDEHITSKPFRVGGHDWAIRYYPNGSVITDGKYICVFLLLLNAGKDGVTATFSFCLQDPASPAAGEKHKSNISTMDFSSRVPGWGIVTFVSKADLATSGCLMDDCLVIKCTVEVITSELIDGDGDDEDKGP